MLDLSKIIYTIRYSIARGSLVTVAPDESTVGSGFIEVEEGKTYCISGKAFYGRSPSKNQGGFFSGDAKYKPGQKQILKIDFYSTHIDGASYFVVPKGYGIKYVCFNLISNKEKTALAGNVQMEYGENPSSPGSKVVARTKSSHLDKLEPYLSFENISYTGISDKIPLFRKHWIRKDKDLVIVNTGTSLTARSHMKRRHIDLR